MRKPRKLLVAALGATTMTFACTTVYGNPKSPPHVDASIDATSDAKPLDAGVDTQSDGPSDSRIPDAP